MKMPTSMKSLPLRLFAVLLLVDIVTLVFEKMGVAQAGSAVGNELAFYLRLAHVPWAWLGIAMGPLQLLVWSKILTKTELSVAYPISSLCFPLTMIAAALCFHEQVTATAWVGAFLITTGVAIVGGGAPEAETDVRPPELVKALSNDVLL